MRIRLEDHFCEEVFEVNFSTGLIPATGEWHVWIEAYGAPYYSYTENKELREVYEQETTLGEMSHEKYASREEAEAAATKILDEIFTKGYLDLRNAYDDWGLETY